MNPADLLTRLEVEGVSVSLNLKVSADEKPSDETRTLIRDNRDALLEYLAGELVNVRSEAHLPDTPDATHGSNFQHAGSLPTSEKIGVTLYGDLLHSLMVWVHRYHELNLEHPCGIVPDARPEHAAHHLQTSAWCVLYDETKTILATAGNVPRHALGEKPELQTTPDVQTAMDTVTAEKVVN